MKVTIKPSEPRGSVKAPPSKSMAHRYLICAAGAEGESRISGISLSEDISATVDCLRALGTDITITGDTAVVKGRNVLEIPSGAVLPCRESGSTLRFMIPQCLFSDKDVTLTGSGRLFERPLGVYEDICREKGLALNKNENSVTVRGPLKSGTYTCPGNVSSQFISGLLMALPHTGGDSRIKIAESAESLSYIGLTLKALQSFGAECSWEKENVLAIGGNRLHAADVCVEGDWSNAAFFLALKAMGHKVDVTGLDPDSLQGDRVFAAYAERIMRGFGELSVKDCPDLAPVLMALAACCNGVRLTDTARLRLKESDRGTAMAQELSKMGITVDVEDNALTVRKGRLTKPSKELDGHNDHRIVMALSVLLTVTGGTINGCEAVGKSYPDYFQALASLGAEVTFDE